MARKRRKVEPGEQLRMAVDSCNSDEVSRLLAEGVDPNEFDSDGQTALTVCAQSGNADLARVLLAAGAQVDTCGTHYIRTPLCFAAARGDLELVQTLVEAGADINIHQADASPLGTATRSGNVEVMRYLLSNGATLTDKGGKAMSTYINQYTKNRDEVEQILREYGAG